MQPVGPLVVRCNKKANRVKHGQVLIKKYGNRRLYDTSASRYVNLDGLAELVRRGADIRVEDAKTGEDLTRVILTQIIVEDARGKQAGLPLELLRQLIVASDQARQDFMMWYLKAAFDTYQKVQETVQNQLSGVRSAATAPLEAMRRFFAAPEAADLDQDQQLSELRRRIAELETKLGKKARTSARTRGSTPPRR